MSSPHRPAASASAGRAFGPHPRPGAPVAVLDLDAHRPPGRAQYDRAVISHLCARHGLRAEQTIRRVLVALADRADALRRAGADGAAIDARGLRDLRDLSAAIGLLDLAAAADALHALRDATGARDAPARAACHARVLRLTDPSRLRAWSMVDL